MADVNTTSVYCRPGWKSNHLPILEDYGVSPISCGVRHCIDNPIRDLNNELLLEFSKLAIEHLNKEKNTNFEFVRVLKAFTEVVCGCKFFITFEAKRAADIEVETFDAMVFLKVGNQGTEVKYCWLACPRANPGNEQYCEPEPYPFGSRFAPVLCDAMDIDD